MASCKVLVLVADGTEEMEAVITVDILRRAQTIQVTVAACQHSNPSFVMCSRGVRLVADCDLESLNERSLADFDMLVLPGGLGGAKLFSQLNSVQAVIALFARDPQKMVAAICAAPIALKAAKVYQGRLLTSHPSVKSELDRDYQYTDDRVVVDGSLITSRGPGTAMEFALTLVDLLVGKEIAENVMKPLLMV